MYKTGLDASWNKFDLFFYFVLATSYVYAKHVQNVTGEAIDMITAHMNQDAFVDLMPLREVMRHMKIAFALLLFLSVMKIFKYMYHIEQVSFLFRVVGSASRELAAFFFTFIIMLFAFSMFAVALFGNAERNFHNVPTAFISLLRMTVGTLDYDYPKLQAQSPTYSWMFVVMFLFTMMLVSVNFFVAILTDSYSRKKAQIEKFVAYKKLARLEGRGLGTAKAGFLNVWKVIFPKWNLQLHPKPWPPPEKIGCTAVRAFHEQGLHGGANIVCLHTMNDTAIVTSRDGQSKQNGMPSPARGRQSTSHAVDVEDTPPPTNALWNAGNVVYLQLVHPPGGAGRSTQVLEMLRRGETMVIKQPGSTGKTVKVGPFSSWG